MPFLGQISQCKAIFSVNLPHPVFLKNFYDFDAVQIFEAQAFGGQAAMKSNLIHWKFIFEGITALPR